MALQFAKPRSTITEDGGRLTIVIPAMRYWPGLLSLPLALMIAGGMGMVLGEDFLRRSENRALFGFMLAVWVFVLVYLLVSFAWMLVGREIVRVENDSLFLKVSVLGVGPLREYPVRDVTGLRVSPGVWHEYYRTWCRDLENSGAIAFDCKGKTRRFGKSLDEVEAKAIIARLQEYTCLWGYAETGGHAGKGGPSGPRLQGL
jgi:hypothetical protein